jgi:hypothetical protein
MYVIYGQIMFCLFVTDERLSKKKNERPKTLLFCEPKE